jgi:predicted 3-demethylubiquinone-9 3-methyltransferase (glyoxalase superfamily)
MPGAGVRQETTTVQKLTPFLWFDDDLDQALAFYASVFPDTEVLDASRAGDGPAAPLFMARFRLLGQELLAINGGPLFPFTEAFSLFVDCEDQAEVDRLWDRLTDGGEPGRCGWLKDRFGLSWQIVPRRLMELMGDPEPARAGRVREAMLAMGKIEIAGLEAAYAADV